MSKKKVIIWVIVAIVLVVLGLSILVAAFAPSLRMGSAARYKADADYYGEQYSLAPESAVGGAQYMAPAKAMAKQAQAAPSVRKLIRRAELDLEVKYCDETAKKITDLVNSYSGIIIDAQIQKAPNEAKRGQTILKVLPKDFDTVLLKLKELGKVNSERVTAEDVTEEYVDLEARLKNAKAVKDRLMAILQDKARTVKDILEVERELYRVGEEIERIEGRMKFLDRQVDLATITVNYYEPKAIAPEPLNVFERFKKTVRLSIEVFINVFNAAIVVIFALIPVFLWLGIIVAVVVLVRKFFRK
ncbi:MAG: DUF4349 domain-containing protein [Candidatus Omnitrophica bacterium]|nr:DUF4349 domain-containing protein [Candidatus Omnitrophota bacterium]